MYELVRMAGLLGIGLGFLIMAGALVAMIINLSNVPQRVRALGFFLVGAMATLTSMSVYVLSLLDHTLPVAAAIPAIVILSVTAVRLRRQASVAFTQYRMLESDRPDKGDSDNKP